MMGTVVFGIAYGALFATLDDHRWWVGALAGIAHGVVVGALFLPMMPLVHPRMGPKRVSALAAARAGGADRRDEVELAAPGLFGRGWGAMTPAGLVMGHAVYGLVVAVTYGWLA